jgi:hypothetical protein
MSGSIYEPKRHCTGSTIEDSQRASRAVSPYLIREIAYPFPASTTTNSANTTGEA